MLWIFLAFIGFITGFTLLLKFSLMLMGRIVVRQVTAKHKAAEEIVNEGRVPRAWASKTRREIFLKRSNSKTQDKTKKKMLKRLDNLIQYFRSSPLVKNEETRAILLDKLRQTRTSWEKEKWEEYT